MVEHYNSNHVLLFSLIREFLKEEKYHFSPDDLSEHEELDAYKVNDVWFQPSGGMIWCGACDPNEEYSDDFLNLEKNVGKTNLEDPDFFDKLKVYLEKHRCCSEIERI